MLRRVLSAKSIQRIAAIATMTISALHGHPAAAVDVVNTDKVAQEVAVNTSDGQSSIVTLAPKEKRTVACETCFIVLGNTSVEASIGACPSNFNIPSILVVQNGVTHCYQSPIHALNAGFGALIDCIE